jgi:hypothetical protein
MFPKLIPGIFKKNRMIGSKYVDWIHLNQNRIWSIAGGGWEFFSSPQCPEQFWSPPNLLTSGYQGLFPWG